MAEQATQRTDADPAAFLAEVPDPGRRDDAVALCELLRDVTGQPPAMWGPSIVGFGEIDYRYATGRSGTWMAIGFSPRKQHLVLYLMDGYEHPKRVADLAALGPHSVGKSCLYLKRLDRLDLDVLRRIVADSYAVTTSRA